jgi:hypothetical protein
MVREILPRSIFDWMYGSDFQLKESFIFTFKMQFSYFCRLIDLNWKRPLYSCYISQQKTLPLGLIFIGKVCIQHQNWEVQIQIITDIFNEQIAYLKGE